MGPMCKRNFSEHTTGQTASALYLDAGRLNDYHDRRSHLASRASAPLRAKRQAGFQGTCRVFANMLERSIASCPKQRERHKTGD